MNEPSKAANSALINLAHDTTNAVINLVASFSCNQQELEKLILDALTTATFIRSLPLTSPDPNPDPIPKSPNVSLLVDAGTNKANHVLFLNALLSLCKHPALVTQPHEKIAALEYTLAVERSAK